MYRNSSRKRQYDEMNINELSLRHSKFANSSVDEAQDPFVLLPPCVLEKEGADFRVKISKHFI